MELLIAGGIALLGYSMSGPGREPRKQRPTYAKQLGPETQYGDEENDTAPLDREFIQKAEQQWLDARDPALTGVVTPHTKLTNAQLPFFRSAKSQNTNDAVKQTRLETFTGANTLDTSLTGTYRHKREVERMFTPSMGALPVTSGGSGGNQMYDRQDPRYENAPWQNNVLPADKIYVGRGIGVGPDVAATDGFHPMYRVMLKNVGEYKKNNLPGSANHPKSNVAKGTVKMKQEINKNPGALVYDQARRPLMPSMAAVQAQQIHPELPRDPGVHKFGVLENDRFGNPTKPGFEPRGRKEARLGYECGDSYDRNHKLPGLNVTGAAAGVGAYAADGTDRFDLARIESQQREWAGFNGFLTGPEARQLPAGQLLPPTQRDMTSRAYVGGVGRVVSGGEVSTRDAPKATLRDTQGDNSKGLTGTKGAVLGGTLDNVWRFNRLDRHAKKGDQLREHTPGAARMNVVLPPDGTAMRPDDVQQAPALFAPALPNKLYNQGGQGASTSRMNKLPAANPRLDLDTAAKQLKCNPYAKTLWGNC